MPPFPHHFQVPTALIPTVQPFCPATSIEQEWLHEPCVNYVEKMLCAQI